MRKMISRWNKWHKRKGMTWALKCEIDLFMRGRIKPQEIDKL